MKVLKWIGIIFVTLIAIIIAFLGYMGYFSTLKVIEKEMGPYTYVYEWFVGPYMDTGAIFEKIEKNLKAVSISTEKAIGFYYDDPAKISKEKLQSDCGMVLEDKDLGKVPELMKKFNVGTFQKKNSIVIEFPVKNMLSYMIGPMKCYDVLFKYAKEKNYKIETDGKMVTTFEYYLKNKILFVMEIVK